MGRFLLRDPVFRIALAVTAATALLASTPALRSLLTTGPGYLAWELPWPLLLLASLFRVPAGTGRAERIFWRLLALSAALWTARIALRTLLGGEGTSLAGLLALDSLTVLICAGPMLAAEAAPDRRRRGPASTPWRPVEALGLGLALVGLFAYFLAIPSQLDPAFYVDRSSAHTFYLAIQMYLLGRFILLAWTSRSRRWRAIYGLFGSSFVLFSAAVLLRWVALSPPRPDLVPSLWDLAFLPPFFTLLCAARLRFAPPLAQAAETAELAPELAPLSTAGRLMIYALALPLAHFGLFAAGWGSPAARGAQEALLFAQTLVLGSLALFQYRLLKARSLALYSQKMRAQERLLLLEKGFETMRLGVAIKDLPGRLLYVNPAEAEMHGYAVEELRGERASTLGLPEEERALSPDSVESVGFWSRDSINRRKDGSRFHVHLMSNLVRDADGTPIAIVTTCEDITERKRIEEALRDSEREYRGLFENAHDAIILLRPADEVVLDANPAACDLYGLSRQELIGVSTVRFSVNPERGKEHLEEALFRGSFYDFETQHYRRDRTVMQLEVRSAMVHYRGETVILSIHRDITARKMVEEALRATNEELKTFLSLVSHDLRAPLVNLRGFAAELRGTAEILTPALEKALGTLDGGGREEAERALREDMPEALDFIDSSVARMDYFIATLLELSRAGHRELEPRPLDLRALVQEVTDGLSYQIGKAGTSVKVVSPPELVADPFCTTQILSNLLANAVTYLEPGRPGEVEVGGERNEHETTVWVLDNGRGVHPDDLEKIFQPFRRCGKLDAPGEGMGLAYVQALVRRQGGRLWVDSEPGVGSTFFFTVSNRIEELRKAKAPRLEVPGGTPWRGS